MTNEEVHAGQPAWSPDGKQIGMVRYAGNSWEIWAINADGTNPHVVTKIVGGDDVDPHLQGDDVLVAGEHGELQQYGGQGRTQLVSDVGDEQAFGAVGFRQFIGVFL